MLYKFAWKFFWVNNLLGCHATTWFISSNSTMVGDDLVSWFSEMAQNSNIDHIYQQMKLSKKTRKLKTRQMFTRETWNEGKMYFLKHFFLERGDSKLGNPQMNGHIFNPPLKIQTNKIQAKYKQVPQHLKVEVAD